VVGADGQFTVATVYQDGEPDNARAAQVYEGVEGGADGPARVEDVVDEHHDFVVDARCRELGGKRSPGRLALEIVTEHGDVQLAGNVFGLHTGIGGRYFGGKAAGQRIAAARNAQQNKILGSLVRLENFMGYTSEGAVNVRFGKNYTG
jgi:hypothetical protein